MYHSSSDVFPVAASPTNTSFITGESHLSWSTLPIVWLTCCNVTNYKSTSKLQPNYICSACGNSIMIIIIIITGILRYNINSKWYSLLWWFKICCIRIWLVRNVIRSLTIRWCYWKGYCTVLGNRNLNTYTYKTLLLLYWGIKGNNVIVIVIRTTATSARAVSLSRCLLFFLLPLSPLRNKSEPLNIADVIISSKSMEVTWQDDSSLFHASPQVYVIVWASQQLLHPLQPHKPSQDC